uniref:Spondin-1 n=1 Tax=Trichobilharzia regenti TaxID=157069 RepID=A0AA85ISE2_TRIRE|nr:unnamed protein product [Trichobilharzia regenti]
MMHPEFLRMNSVHNYRHSKSNVIYYLLIFTLVVSSNLESYLCLNRYNKLRDDCNEIPNYSSVTRRPGDGGMEIRIQLLPPDVKRRRGSGNNGHILLQSSDLSSVSYKPPVNYLNNRDYLIVVAPKLDPQTPKPALRLESVYLTAVPLGTPESEEFNEGKGRFMPTICSNPAIGAIRFAYNFPNHVSFVWTSPAGSESTTLKYTPNVQNFNSCLEIRATIIPWHWHRFYFKNAGSLRHVLCPAMDLRQIDEWSEYLHSNTKSFRKIKSDNVKARSITNIGRVDGEDGKNHRYSDSGYYGTEETDSCSVQELPKPVRPCCACNTAIYRLIIQSDWQQQQHWRDWPTTMAGAGSTASENPHWSEILGASHSPQYDIFHAGGYASPAVDALCTTSDVSKLESEFRNQAGENILTVIRTRGIDSMSPPEQRFRSALFAVNSSHHLLSFLTRIVPSPDWCTGLSRVDVCLPNCSWPLRMQFRLEPWDAGVMTGNTYIPIETSERLREPKPMCPITPDLRPNTPFTVLTDYVSLPNSDSFGLSNLHTSGSNAFRNPNLGVPMSDQMNLLNIPSTTGRMRRQFARLGMVELELLRVNEHESCASEILQEDQAVSKASNFPRRDSGTSGTGMRTTESVSRKASSDMLGVRCHLSEWSPWSPCTQVDLDTCSTDEAKAFWQNTPPRMWRTRHSISESNNEDCLSAKLKEEMACDIPTAKQACGPIPVSTPQARMYFMDSCSSLPWGPWSPCNNATCTRPGMIYRWRRFPDHAAKTACEKHPLASQVDTCWPPSNIHCSVSELQTACQEEPPTPQRLCVRPLNTTKRYFYSSATKHCKEFDYVPECHLRALFANHPISLTRNVFKDRNSCEQLCMHKQIQSDAVWNPIVKREIDNYLFRCDQPLMVGSSCYSNKKSYRWYYDQQLKRCISFEYMGCNGNGNNFRTEHECKMYCVYQNNPTKNLDGSNTTNTSDKPTSSTNSSSNKWIQMPQDCRYTLWTDWSGCSATCGPGTMTRVRERISPQLDNCQTLLPDVEQRTTCFLKAC